MMKGKYDKMMMMMNNNKMMQQHNDHHSDEEEVEENNDVDSDNEDQDEDTAEMLTKEGIDIIAVENTADGDDSNNEIAYEDEDLEYYADVATDVNDIFPDPIAATATEEPTAVPSKHHPHPPPPPPLPPCGEIISYAQVMPPQKTWYQYFTNTHPPMPPHPPCADGMYYDVLFIFMFCLYLCVYKLNILLVQYILFFASSSL